MALPPVAAQGLVAVRLPVVGVWLVARTQRQEPVRALAVGVAVLPVVVRRRRLGAVRAATTVAARPVLTLPRLVAVVLPVAGRRVVVVPGQAHLQDKVVVVRGMVLRGRRLPRLVVVQLRLHLQVRTWAVLVTAHHRQARLGQNPPATVAAGPLVGSGLLRVVPLGASLPVLTI